MELFNQDRQTALEAKEYVQFLAFGPIAFQAAKTLLNLGLLTLVEGTKPKGATLQDLARESTLSIYGTRILLEAGLGVGLLTVDQDRFHLTKAGHFLLHDRMTRVNLHFVSDVCYRGMEALEKSLLEGKPEGLKVFGAGPTIYEALAQLPQEVQQSWLNFDHYYSDAAFPEALRRVFEWKPRRILDIGGNTGRWAMQCTRYSDQVEVCIADLPGQLRMAETEIRKHGAEGRISYHPVNLLDTEALLPTGFDVLWMSQFLDCFSQNQIQSILAKCREVMSPRSRLFILEPLWDRQRFRAAAFSLQMTSLYFAAMANGNSQMYPSGLLLSCLQDAGFLVEDQWDQVGVCHTLIHCRPS